VRNWKIIYAVQVSADQRFRRLRYDSPRPERYQTSASCTGALSYAINVVACVLAVWMISAKRSQPVRVAWRVGIPANWLIGGHESSNNPGCESRATRATPALRRSYALPKRLARALGWTLSGLPPGCWNAMRTRSCARERSNGCALKTRASKQYPLSVRLWLSGNHVLRIGIKRLPLRRRVSDSRREVPLEGYGAIV
jgi:hypothetical protein